MKKIRFFFSWVTLVVWFGVTIMVGSLAFADRATALSMDKAKRVEMMLERLAKQKRHSVFMKKVTFTEDELNSYLNLIYVKTETPEVTYVWLKLEKDNFVRGTIKIKLDAKEYSSVPSFLRDIELETMGKIECQNYRMRFIFQELKVNGNSFAPEILDEAFGAAQGGVKVKRSLYDWFSLLPGIKSITVGEREITIFY